jgi:alkylation response protein AidB-like acyl-CoA dehydrogenase
MAFSFSEDQDMFRDALRRSLADQPRPSDVPTDPRDWRMAQMGALADLGVFAALLPETAGGLGLGPVEAMIIGEELGRAVLATPIIDTVALTGLLLTHAEVPDDYSDLLAGIVAGKVIGAFAGDGILDPQAGFVARPVGDFWRLTGAAPVVTFAPVAETIVLVATVAGDEDNVALFAVPADRVLQTASFWTIDDLPAASIAVQDADLGQPFAVGAAAAAALAQAWDIALLMQAAELNGLIATLLNQTASHLRLRKQFGVSLSSFQALQHRFAEMVLAYHQSLALTQKAAWLLDGCAAPERGPLLWAMAAQAGQAARLIGHEAIQMHGAMGLTEELIVGPAVKRLVAIEPRLGRPQFHVDRYADFLARKAA